jgi:hypothetical protein
LERGENTGRLKILDCVDEMACAEEEIDQCPYWSVVYDLGEKNLGWRYCQIRVPFTSFFESDIKESSNSLDDTWDTT